MRSGYRLLGYIGLVSIFGSLLYGFRYDPDAPGHHVVLAVGLYAAWVGVHLLMTTAWFKRRFWGEPRGKPAERRVFIVVSVTTWLLVFAIHPAVPGWAVAAPDWVHFAGIILVLIASRSFFDGVSSQMLDGMLAVPGAGMVYSHGTETPLMTEGPYARVRHPMYRAAIMGCVASLLIHPHLGQLLWAGMIGLTFVAFIPVEERQLRAARGEAYMAYCAQTPYRLFVRFW